MNTLALSIVERTREIGVLQAIGMTRAQLTRMIRVESEITALIGAVVGIVVGLGLAALTTKALPSWELSSASPGSRCSCSRPPPSSPGSLRASPPPPRRTLGPLDALHHE